jgi:DNA-binding transcriptional ArsR family regulator
MAIDDLFRALGDPTRRAILRILRDGDLSAGELAARFPLAKSTLSGHFAILRHAGLIVAERRGTTIVYSLSIGAVEELMSATMALFGVGSNQAGRDAPQEMGHGEEMVD